MRYRRIQSANFLKISRKQEHYCSFSNQAASSSRSTVTSGCSCKTLAGSCQEDCTQGDRLRAAAAFYREGEGKALIEKVKAEYRAKGMRRVILSGMGSSLYAMDTVRSYLTARGIPCLAFSAFELSRFQFGQLDDKTLLIAVSQSGNSAEVVELVDKARQVTTVVGIYNNEGSILSRTADIALPIRAGKCLPRQASACPQEPDAADGKRRRRDDARHALWPHMGQGSLMIFPRGSDFFKRSESD